MITQPLVLIVILNWNGAEETLAALTSLSCNSYRNWRVLIVDNGSTDDSLATLQSVASDTVEVLGRATNTGYTGGCNLGLRRGLEIHADYVWLLNNDAVVEADTLSSLVAVAESDATVGLVSPLIADLQDPRKVIIAGAIFDRRSLQHADTHDVAVAQRWYQERPAACIVHGTAMLVPARLIRAIGVLDNSLGSSLKQASGDTHTVTVGCFERASG